jgi:L-ribulose-5-phosphate 3-epimerase
MANRRKFLQAAAITTGSTALGALYPEGVMAQAQGQELFKISLAQWSLVRPLFAGDLSNLDFPGFARSEFGIEAVEYVNQFWMDKAEDKNYLIDLKQRCDDNGVRSLLIMCDREGALGDPDGKARTEAITNHYKWVAAAAFLGCHSIRVNAQSSGPYEEQQKLAADGLNRLSEFAADYGLNVIVENHGGLSSNGKWLAGVMDMVGRENCGTLPDFGNFRITPDNLYDHYLGVEELMPYALGVSAKAYEFDENGNETFTDFERMMRIVLDAGYRGYVGVEWEGRMPEPVEGIKLTKALLERVRNTLQDSYA